MGNSGGVTILNGTNYPLNIYLSMGAPHHYCNCVKPKEAFTIHPGAVWYTVNAYLDFKENRMTDGKVAKGVALIAIPSVIAGVGALFTGGASLAAMGMIAGVETSVFAMTGVAVTSTLLVDAAVAGAYGTVFAGVLTGFLTNEASSDPEAIMQLAYSPDFQAEFQRNLEEFQEAANNSKLLASKKGVYCGGDHKYLKVFGGPYKEEGRDGRWKSQDLGIKTICEDLVPRETKRRKKNDPVTYWDA